MSYMEAYKNEFWEKNITDPETQKEKIMYT